MNGPIKKVENTRFYSSPAYNPHTSIISKERGIIGRLAPDEKFAARYETSTHMEFHSSLSVPRYPVGLFTASIFFFSSRRNDPSGIFY